MIRNNFRLIFMMVLALILVFGLFGCSPEADEVVEEEIIDDGEEISSDEFTAESPLVVRMGTLTAPADSTVKATLLWAELLDERSEGRIKLEVFPSGELGNNAEGLRMLQEGTIEIWDFIPATVAFMDESIELAALPGLHLDYDSAIAADRGYMGDILEEYNSALGIRKFVSGAPIFYNVFGTPAIGRVSSLDDLRGTKIRIMESPMLSKTFIAAGISATPVTWGEVYTSLERNVIDGAFAPLTWAVDAGWHEAATEISLLNVFYAASNWYLSEKRWSELPDDLRLILEESFDDVEKILWELAQEQYENNLQMLIDNPRVTVHEITAEEQLAFREAVMKLWPPVVTSVWGEEVLNILLEQ